MFVEVDFGIELEVENEFGLGIVFGAGNSFEREFELEVVAIVVVYNAEIFVRNIVLEYLSFELDVMVDLQHSD